MDKVFHFDSPREEYHADAAVVWCFDHRFNLGFAKFLKRSGMATVDAIKLAGGAKSLASPERETDREFVLGQLQKSVRLHGTRRVILMVHSDCGGYGGLAAFGGDPAAEAKHHEEELRRAADYVAQQIPEIEVQAYFADFEGVWAVDLTPVTAQ
ncbi:MAG TPA: carbonic anhydrase [Bryobacteraceae bacterium]|nr:carbonic anhydrase [Bryobacteraceae bacterium]